LFLPKSDGIITDYTGRVEIRTFEKANHLTPTTIVALTGLGSAKARQEAFTSGVDLFLTKPVAMKKLKSLIEDGVSSNE